MEFHPENTSCGDAAMSTVLARLKSLKVKLDVTTFLDGKGCYRGQHSDDGFGGGRDRLVPNVHKLDTILDKCSTLQELNISASRVFLGSGCIGYEYSLGQGTWASNLQRLALSDLFITYRLQRTISYETPAIQAISLVDCYAPSTSTAFEATWRGFFVALMDDRFPSTLRALQVVNTRSKNQFEYAHVVGGDYCFEIAEPERSWISVEVQRT